MCYICNICNILDALVKAVFKRLQTALTNKVEILHSYITD